MVTNEAKVSDILTKAWGWLEELTVARPGWEWSFEWNHSRAIVGVGAKKGKMRFRQIIPLWAADRVTVEYLLHEFDLEVGLLEWAESED